MYDRVWTISNFLSILRVLLVIPVALLLQSNADRTFTAILVLVAAATDLSDGWLARKLDQVTEFGKILDPIADKICIAVIGIVLTVQGRLPLWFVVFAISRDAAIAVGGMYVKKERGIVLMSNWAGKLATCLIAALILLIVLDVPSLRIAAFTFLYLSAAALALSSLLYLRRFLEVLSAPAAGIP
jgi:CDP-diacylglycerol--glycerol-3-phosphate 3-phosphatidyltransferase